MIYKLTVLWTDDDGEKKIEIGGPGDEQEIITETSFWIDTVNDNAKNKEKGTLARLKIKGKIDPSNAKNSKVNKSLTALFKWSTDFKNSTTYREVIVEVYSDTDEDNVFRKYKLENVFIRDYQEVFHTPDGSKSDEEDKEYAYFELDMTQQENHWDKVEAIDL